MVNIEIKSLDDLAAAVKRMGGELIRNQTTYEWYGTWVNDYHDADAAYLNGVKPEDYGKCEHAIHFDGCRYEVGVIRRPDGKPGYTVIWDFIDGGLRGKLGGPDARLLKQNYAIAAATRTAKLNGYHVTEKVGLNGAVQLVCSK